jgi:hypothetical protein
MLVFHVVVYQWLLALQRLEQLFRKQKEGTAYAIPSEDQVAIT